MSKNKSKTPDPIRVAIETLAMQEWYALGLKRIKTKPSGVRIECCGIETGLIAHKVYPVPGDSNNYLNVLMTMCTGCGVVHYWVEWPDDDVLYRDELKELQEMCDDALKGLL